MEKLSFNQSEALRSLRKFQENLRKTPHERRTEAYYNGRLTLLESYFETFLTRHNVIVDLVFADNGLKEKDYFKNDEFSVYEELYLVVKEEIMQKLELLTESKKNVDACSNNVNGIEGKCSLKLPRIEIPKFYGNYQDWASFRDLFCSLVHTNMKLSKVERLHYLKSHLSGEAAQLLKHIAITESNYDQAWQSLVLRYENKRVIVNAHLSSLLSQPHLSSESAVGIRKLLDTTTEVLHALKNMSIDTTSWDPIMVFITVQRLDTESRRLWEQSLGSKTELSTFKELQIFLESRYHSLEAITGTRPKPVSLIKQAKPNSIRTFHLASDPPCPSCSGPHFLYKCDQFKQLPIAEKKRIVYDKGLCINCLVPGHFSSGCRQRTRCHSCNKRHHSLLHIPTVSSIPGAISYNTKESSHNRSVAGPSTITSHVLENQIKTHFGNSPFKHKVMLATAIVRVLSATGSHLLRALLDQGSEGSLITENAAQLLQLTRKPTRVGVRGIGSTSIGSAHHEVSVQICPRISSIPILQIDALVMPTLTGLVPSYEVPEYVRTKFGNLELADPECFEPGRIDLLLGADIYPQIILPEMLKHSPELPIAQRTLFGWVISGPFRDTLKKSERRYHCVFNDLYDQVEVEKVLRRFWEIEEVADRQSFTPEEEACERYFEESVKRTSEGRYIVRLPLKSVLEGLKPPTFERTKEAALHRFNSLEGRLTRSPQLKVDYSKFMQEYLVLGHMELAQNSAKGKYYIPHHPVFKNNSTTTKLRVVFDASSKGSNSTSLNDSLSVCPSLQSDLFDILLRWRKYRVVLAADIEKMYRQILVSAEDIPYQHIVWRFNKEEDLKEFRLLTVTYGTSCAPYLAIRTLRQLAQDHAKEHPEAAQIVLKNFYVDDAMFGADDEDIAKKLQSDLISLLALGGFHLRKWSSNQTSLLSQISVEDREMKTSVELGDENAVTTLGIQWFPLTDAFGYKVSLPPLKNSSTKRSLLSDIARLFDPLGWLSPILIVAKIILQKLWLNGTSWDENLPVDLEKEWLQLRNELPALETIKIHRWIYYSSSRTSVQLHGFSDASTKAYAAVVYIRIEGADKTIHTSLLTAKTRVAPVKQISVPRLELCAASLLAKLMTNVQRALDIPDVPLFVWSDSSIVLAWLKNHPSRWKTFVANRVSDIQLKLNSSHWRYVPTKDNPADCASRGLNVSQLRSHVLWWKGPAWLSQDPNSWPLSTSSTTVDTDLEERKTKKHITIVCSNDFDLLARYSSLQRLVRITAYCLRFIDKCRKRYNCVQAKILQTCDLNRAFKRLCVISQAEDFSTDIDRLRQGIPLSKRSKIVMLDPFLDSDGILRVGGRLNLSNLPINTKHQIIVSQNSPLAKLLATDAHIVTLHGGNNLTLSYLRRKFWILHAKGLVRQTIHCCVKCVRYRAASRVQMMGNLPKDRVTFSRPFLHSGVDYAGPVTLKAAKGRGTLKFKGYICLFICLATKAVHLELVSDYSSEEFIAAFRRFTARRGKCSSLYSDCGTTFIGANTEMTKSYRQSECELPHNISTILANDNTTWKFIPPASPHFGGLWEAGIKSTKHHLRRIMGEVPLTFEEYTTVLTQIEAVLNSRPLCPLSDDPSDCDVLTPAHFLIGEPLIGVPEPSLLEINVNRLSRWQLSQRLYQQFWRRWTSEYITRLQQRPKWHSKNGNLKEGNLVIVKDEKLPPAKWLLGRVVTTHSGLDNLVRVVTLKTKNGIIKRPVVKLCLLPVTEPVEETNTPSAYRS